MILKETNVATLVEQAKTIICNGVRTGQYPIQSQLPSVEDLAVTASCSTETMRRALTELAREGVVQRIKRYGTMVIARPSRGRVCVLASRDIHTNQMLQELVCTALRNADVDVDMVPVSKDLVAASDWISSLLLKRRPPEILVVLSSDGHMFTNQDLFLNILDRFPKHVLVMFDHFSSSPKIGEWHILYNHWQSAGLVMNHLRELGHKKVACVAGNTDYEICNVYRELLEQAEDLFRMAGMELIPYYHSSVIDGLVKLIKEDGVTAFWDQNDSVAFKTLIQLHQHGIHVPQDVSIVGRFDTPWAQECHPPLTTVSMNPEGMAQAISQAVVDALDGNQQYGYTKVSSKLVVRDSTGPAPVE